MENKNPILSFWQKSWWSKLIVIIVGIFILFTIIGILTPQGQKSFKEGQEAGNTIGKPSPTPTSTPTPSKIPVVTKKPTSKPTSVRTLTIKDKIKQALGKDFQDDSDLKITYDGQSKTAIISYGDHATFWNESSMVEGLFAVFVQQGKEIFKVEGVDNLKMTVRNEFTDTYGKKNIEDAASLEMTKEEFRKYNWDSLRFQPIYYQMERSATELYIHPGILTKINLTELKLKY